MAQTAQFTTTLARPKTPARTSNNLMLTLETETMSVRDGNYDITGVETYYLAEPGYRFGSDIDVRLGASYRARNAGGTLSGAEKANKDHMETYYAKFNYRAARFSNNKIIDLRLQARAYSDQDDFFKRRFAGDGNYQFRAYFGRPIYGNWSINRFTSYLRYKNYFNNQYVTDFSRDYELRARISPTYRAMSGLDLGMTFTYNHIFKVNKLADEEGVDIDLTARYQYDKYAVLFRVGAPYMTNSSGQGVLKENEAAGKDFNYALTFTAFL